MAGTQPTSNRTTVRRIPARGVYDRALINAVLDEALICHVGFVDDGQPFVMPTIHARFDDQLVLHGSRGSRMLRTLASGAPACITVTLLDGLVLARSAFHHSMNYRSVVVLGKGVEVTDRETKLAMLDRLVEHVVPGRTADARGPDDNEFEATMVVALPIDECSAKVRTGPPGDEEADYALDVWAGLIPLSVAPGEPIDDPLLREGIPQPKYARSYVRPGRNGS